MAAAGLEFRILGPLEVAGREAGALRVTAAKQRALLVSLLLHANEVVAADRLAEELWGESQPRSAGKLIQAYVVQLRRALGGGAIETRAPGYRLMVEPEQVDAARFERLFVEGREALAAGNAALAGSRLRRALGLWRGRALADVAYADFARGEAERLEELRLDCLEERIEADLALGRHEDVLAELAALVGEHPLRERLRAHLMLALYRSGRQAEALAAFSEARRALDELGLEPSAELRGLQRAILRQDRELARPDGVVPAAGRVPVPLTPLIGRERELAGLRGLVSRPDVRLATLAGAGGSGKTRLALALAEQCGAEFANGAAFVEVASVQEPALVLPALARALEIAETPGEPISRTLAAALASQELLLVVDNLEHLVEAAPALVALAAAAPHVTLVVTSRRVLHVRGEHVFPVEPLAEDAAVELFLARARALDVSRQLSAEDAAAVREICRRVDGLPLAIELAAARTRTLAPAAVLARLSERLTVLAGGPHDLPARQQTLRETISWSVELVDEQARQVFARLAVFPGGATLEAAETVCGGDLDTLAALVDVHLLRREEAGGEPRFGMFDTIREYALELLGDQRAEVELALAEYLAQFADHSGLNTRDYGPAVDQLDPEVDNLRLALAAAAASGDAELLVRLAGGLWRYWSVRGPAGEGLEWIERALAAGAGPASAARARALHGGAGLAWLRGDRERAKELAGAAIPVAVESGSTWAELAAHTVLGIVTNAEGDHAIARYHHGRSLELREQLGHEPVLEKLNLGVVALDCGDYQEALRLFEEVLASHRRNENTGGIGFALLNLGEVYHALGDHQAARAAFEEARVCMEQAGLLAQAAYALAGIAAAEASEARFDEAARLLGQARREIEDVGQSGDEFAEIVAWAEERARDGLGDDAFETAFAAGHAAG